MQEAGSMWWFCTWHKSKEHKCPFNKMLYSGVINYSTWQKSKHVCKKAIFCTVQPHVRHTVQNWVHNLNMQFQANHINTHCTHTSITPPITNAHNSRTVLQTQPPPPSIIMPGAPAVVYRGSSLISSTTKDHIPALLCLQRSPYMHPAAVSRCKTMTTIIWPPPINIL